MTDYVREHPGGELSLDRLARVANLSPYHFHRMFRIFTGETVGELVQRTRLAAAAAALRGAPSLSVTDAAFTYGYESLDGFSRAFKRHFGCLPSVWNRVDPLQERKIGRVDGAFPSYTLPELERAAEKSSIAPEVVRLPGRRLLYLRIADAYHNTQAVVGDCDRLLAWHAEQVSREPQLFGISWDDPDLTPVERCTFEWAVAVDGSVPCPDWLAEREMAPLVVARVRLVGGLELEDLIWQYLYRLWLPRSGYEPAKSPAMEIYERLPTETGWEQFDMWCALPVAPGR